MGCVTTIDPIEDKRDRTPPLKDILLDGSAISREGKGFYRKASLI